MQKNRKNEVDNKKMGYNPQGRNQHLYSERKNTSYSQQPKDHTDKRHSNLRNVATTSSENDYKRPTWLIRQEREVENKVSRFEIFIKDRFPLNSSYNAWEILSDMITDFLENYKNKIFQSELKVSGGGYGLAHHSRNEFLLLQSKKFNSDKEIQGIEIPYNSSIKGSLPYKELIDYLFIGRRHTQPLSSKENNIFAPEFYWHFARNYVQKQLGDFYSHNLFKITALDKFLFDKKVPYLYCPVGEVSFFLYAWRLLFRCCQKNKKVDSVFDNDFSLNDKFEKLDVWQETFWHTQSGSSPNGSNQVQLPEYEWMMALKELEELNTRHESKTEFKHSVLKQWEFWKNEVDTNTNKDFCPWQEDWFNLKMIDEPNNMGAFPTRVLMSLLLFAFHVEPQQDIRQAILSTINKVAAFIRKKKKRLTWKEIVDIDLLLQDVVLFLLSNQEENDEDFRISIMLSKLHRIARFPILPLFYWIATSGMPKEHFVFPIWESRDFPIRVKIPGESEEIYLPFVGICLLGLEPNWDKEKNYYDEMLQFINSPKETDISALDNEQETIFLRLKMISRFYRQIGRPLIDSVFYGTLVRDSFKSEAILRLRSDLAATFSHAYQKRATMFVNSFAEFIDRTLAMDLWIDASGSPTNPVVKEFYDKGCIVDDPDKPPYGQLLDFLDPIDIKRSDLVFAFDHRAALEWYKDDIDVFYHISRFDKTFHPNKFFPPKTNQKKIYLYHIALVKLVESILVLKYQGKNEERSTYNKIFKSYNPSKEWSYWLIKAKKEIEKGGDLYLSELEQVFMSSDFPIKIEVDEVSVRKPNFYLNKFISSADPDAVEAEQNLLIEIIGKILAEIFLNSLRGGAKIGNPYFELKFHKSLSSFHFYVTTNCPVTFGKLLSSSFEEPTKPEYQQGWGRYGNHLVMRDYLHGKYEERKTNDNSVTTRLSFPIQMIGGDNND